MSEKEGMVKYGNANFEKQLDGDGATLVSNVPITEKMKKEASAVVNGDKQQQKAEGDVDIINVNDRQKG